MKKNLTALSQKTSLWLGAVIIGLVIGVSLQFVRAAWTEPPVSPPDANVAAPISESIDSQIKAGNLQVNALGINSSAAGALLVNGSVGIGTVTPKDTKTNIIDMKDAWLRDADGGNGAWASSLIGGSEQAAKVARIVLNMLPTNYTTAQGRIDNWSSAGRNLGADNDSGYRSSDNWNDAHNMNSCGTKSPDIYYDYCRGNSGCGFQGIGDYTCVRTVVCQLEQVVNF
jgi:hypothetical protein